jgi:diguanylate cyclase (GGDEF)-like protein
MDTPPIRVLLIEDNPGDARLIREALSDSGAAAIQIDTASNLAEGFAALDQGSRDVVLLDLSLPDSQGLDTVSRTRAHSPETPIVVLSGLNDEDTAVQAVREGAQDYLVKGEADGNLLMRSIRYAIERHRMQAALRILSLVDELTGLYNRRGFMTLAEHQVKLSQRKKTGFYLIFADLDGMKAINDTHGHPAGDMALTDTANLLTETFRGSDIIARMGGDEFAIITIDSNNNSAEAIEQRLQRRVAAFNDTRRRPYCLSLSVGVVHYDPQTPTPIPELLDAADKLMYAQKRKKKSCRPDAAGG